MRQFLQQIMKILDGTPIEYGKRGQGQSTIELALMMPLMLVLLSGIIEMGWFTNNYLILLEASRVGAREGTKLSGDSSPLTWERGSVTLIAESSAGAGDGFDLNTDRGVIPVYTGQSLTQRQSSEFARGGRHIPERYAVQFAAEEGEPEPNPWTTDKTQGSSRPQCSDLFNLGFYTRVACQAWISMSPLDEDVLAVPINGPADDWNLNRIDDPVNPGAEPDDPPHPSNDIVVSVFSLNLVPAGCNGSTDGLCSDTDYATLTDSLQRPFRLAADDTTGDTEAQDFANLAPVELDAGGNPGSRNPDAAQIMVTGRYPSNANECASDTRDPFDVNGNGSLDPWEIDPARLNVINGGNSLFDTAAQDQFSVDFDGNGADETLSFRGFSFTGKWPRGADGGCIGSEWSVSRMERLVNLRDANVTVNEMGFLPDRQGVALVEMFWRHELLIDLPFFGSIFRMFGASGGPDDDSGYIRVWAAFPISSVSFDLDLSRTCDDLLFQDGADMSVINCP